MHSLCSAVHLAFNLLNVGIPDSVGSSMRMADIIAEVSAFTAYITLCHDETSFYRICLKRNIGILPLFVMECKIFYQFLTFIFI